MYLYWVKSTAMVLRHIFNGFAACLVHNRIQNEWANEAKRGREWDREWKSFEITRFEYFTCDKLSTAEFREKNVIFMHVALFVVSPVLNTLFSNSFFPSLLEKLKREEKIREIKKISSYTKRIEEKIAMKNSFQPKFTLWIFG